MDPCRIIHLGRAKIAEWIRLLSSGKMPCETGWHAKMAMSVEVHRLGLGKMPGVCKGLPQSHESVFKSLWATHAGSLPRWTHGETADLIFYFYFWLLVEWAFRLLAPNFFFDAGVHSQAGRA